MVKAYAKPMCKALRVQEIFSLQYVFLSTDTNLSADGKEMFQSRKSYAPEDQRKGFET